MKISYRHYYTPNYLETRNIWTYRSWLLALDSIIYKTSTQDHQKNGILNP